MTEVAPHEDPEPDAVPLEEPGEDPGSPDTTVPDVQPDDTDGPSDDDATETEPEGEPGTDDDVDAAEDTPPAAPDTESVLDGITKKLSTAGRNYGKRVADILGDDWYGIVPCPLCSEHYPGLLTPAPPSEQAIAAVRPLIGLPDLTMYRQDPFARTCDVCDGQTKTLTGSRDPKYATKLCPACKGTGFRSSAPEDQELIVSNGYQAAPPPTHVEDEPPPGMPQASIDALEKMLAAARNQGVAR